LQNLAYQPDTIWRGKLPKGKIQGKRPSSTGNVCSSCRITILYVRWLRFVMCRHTHRRTDGKLTWIVS